MPSSSDFYFSLILILFFLVKIGAKSFTLGEYILDDTIAVYICVLYICLFAAGQQQLR